MYKVVAQLLLDNVNEETEMILQKAFAEVTENYTVHDCEYKLVGPYGHFNMWVYDENPFDERAIMDAVSSVNAEIVSAVFDVTEIKKYAFNKATKEWQKL